MRRALFSAISFVLVFGCGSVDNRVKGDVPTTDLAISQTNSLGGASRTMSGPLPMNFQVEILNGAKESIRLKRLEVQSVGQGAYTVQNTSRPFDATIAPGETGRVEFWAPTVIENTISGANGPVTLRVTAYFSTARGDFREVYMRNVNDPLTTRRVGE